MNIFGDDDWISNNGVAYEVGWCHLCDCARIKCPSCENSSCNGGGCPECMKDWEEFQTYKVSVTDYLTPEEIKTHFKIEALKRKIPAAIGRREPVLNFEKLNSEGHLSKHDCELFGLPWIHD